MTNQERLAHLLEIVEKPTNNLVTISSIRDKLTPESYQLVLSTIATAKASKSTDVSAIAEAAEMEALFISMSVNGLSLSSPLRQDALDRLAVSGKWSPAVRDEVKALGVTRQTRWQIEGYAIQPTLTIVENETKKAVVKQTATDRWNVFIDAMDAWDGSGDEPVL